MARAEILLMNENGTRLAQNNLLTDIKVFPSSFSIKAALGNLKISDDSLPGSHSYFWMCDMRNPGGSSFVENVHLGGQPRPGDKQDDIIMTST
ncbi:hypothetical protein C5167_013823 [Papaver somniferum]|uniref:Uncharacterized protein n=1 Tax=Papaver somniferum TaxID=3469 RepID=A0A4Y7J4J2_PAPSO|nr:hypothetical protein C5167_013823 [Papaver somniferum]